MAVRKDKKTQTWIVDVSKGVDAVTGKRNRFIKKNIPTRREAIELEQFYRVTKLNEKKLHQKISLDMLYTMLQREDKINQRKKSYCVTQEYNYNAHFSAYFKNTDIALLTYENVEEFRNFLLEKNLSNNTVNKQMILLKKTLDIAVRKNYLSDNPCCHLKKLKIQKTKMKFWTIDEFLHFRSLFKDEEYAYQLFFTVAFFTGMRLGELLALNWEDINFAKKEISVSKTLFTLKGEVFINSPKTLAGERRISINSKLSDELYLWKEKQHNLLAKFTDEPDLLQLFQFCPEIMNRDMIRKKFESVMKRTDKINKIRIHDFRHSHVALLIENKEDPYTIKERIGHSSITTIYDFYGHLYPSKQKNTADRLDDLY
ncbi:MAG: tyrosine-type recombinase/integrase [Carnobacterium maltaromaticum]|uniref:tyrosine-type recombinase/integrase n=1 Tax=Carnobacterium maltaromaticum TaxID=2751 RepID=UPI00191BA332|nr:site-specific integrase [Carnobacterium maltaromaticum]CAD5902050.1 ICEBs1 integrase [Carnobacterium maltaromaticum]